MMKKCLSSTIQHATSNNISFYIRNPLLLKIIKDFIGHSLSYFIGNIISYDCLLFDNISPQGPRNMQKLKLIDLIWENTAAENRVRWRCFVETICFLEDA